MRSSPIGLVLLNDERPHVVAENEADNLQVLHRWAAVVRARSRNRDGSGPDLLVGEETIKSVRSAQAVAERLRRAGARSIVLVFTSGTSPTWSGRFSTRSAATCPSCRCPTTRAPTRNVGLLATDGALRQAGLRTHRIVGNVEDEATRAKVATWVRAAQAVTTMRNEVYGLYGGHSMGMETGFFHLVPTHKALGTTAGQIDQLWVVERMRARR